MSGRVIGAGTSKEGVRVEADASVVIKILKQHAPHELAVHGSLLDTVVDRQEVSNSRIAATSRQSTRTRRHLAAIGVEGSNYRARTRNQKGVEGRGEEWRIEDRGQRVEKGAGTGEMYPYGNKG